ncbi:surface protease GP63 [Trypanosoma conorhini]|uniref:Leishmanolysin-like peptidase n=1 Tax=Trypanosoma conorhini TaxID=83891 RepID=A0A3S5ITF8_9TRYP|nr:surface protease GP63 [Trypanosoma conorhini]RNF17737.1 surface protease GP63 [Trypanosoma conorhini]
MTPEKVKLLTEEILPAAVKLHTDRLRVLPLTAPLLVPRFAEGSSVCKHYTVPEDHHTRGVDADMVLYVAAGPGFMFGVPCATVGAERPVVGALRFVPADYGGLRVNVRAVAHVIAHALGFGYEQMRALGMVAGDPLTAVRHQAKTSVASATVLKEARAHYNCKTLENVELEVDNYTGVVEPHWPQRLAKGELMSDSLGFGVGRYTALTLAAFEDMKFYRADFSMAEPMAWGSNSGCGLFSGSCLENGVSLYPGMFCDKIGFRCTADRASYGMCSTERDSETQALKLEGDCPTVDPTFLPNSSGIPFATVCSEDMSAYFPHMLHGDDSWCLDGQNLKVTNPKAPSGQAVGGVCARVKCEAGRVQVRYRGNEEWHECPEGSSITPQSEHFRSGNIMCPSYEEVCTVAANGSSLLVPGRGRRRDGAGGSAAARTAGSLLLLVLTTVAVVVPL